MEVADWCSMCLFSGAEAYADTIWLLATRHEDIQILSRLSYYTVCIYVCMHVPMYAQHGRVPVEVRGQSARVLGIKLRSPGLVACALTHWTILLSFLLLWFKLALNLWCFYLPLSSSRGYRSRILHIFIMSTFNAGYFSFKTCPRHSLC